MNTNSLPVFVGALLAGTLSAQSQDAQAFQVSRVPIHTTADDLGVPYGTWGAGSTYKASFHDGMTFVPYLGADYPKNQPWSWRTTSVKAGATELLEAGVAPQHAQQDYRYEYRFGAVTEAYDVLDEGLEQTFVIHTRPPAGDLVITGAVTSMLRSRAVAAAQQSLTFRDDAGQPITSYGKAIAFDARGLRTPVTTAYDEGELRLTVAGSWLEHAIFPVTVDPILGRVQVVNSSTAGELRQIDIGRDDESPIKNVMFAYKRSASQFDGDVYAHITNDNYLSPNLVYSDITTSWDSDGPRCAFVGGGDRWAMVFRRYFASNPLRLSQLRCRVHQKGSITFGTSFGSLAPGTGRNDWACDVGGVESSATGSHALVVFQRENNSNTAGHWANTATSAVYGSRLDVTTTSGTFGPAVLIHGNANNDFERPSVNKVAEGGSSFKWVVASKIYDTFYGWGINVRAVTGAGLVSLNGMNMMPSLYGIEHSMGPIVEGADGRYALVCTSTDIATTPNKNHSDRGKTLWIQRFDWATGQPTPTLRTPVMLDSATDKRFTARGLAFDTNDESHFALTYVEQSSTVRALRYVRTGYDGRPTETGNLYSVAPTSFYPYGGDVVFDNDDSDFLFSYGTSGRVYGQTLQYQPVTAPSLAGFGCSSAIPGWAGNQQIGAEFNGVYVTSAPAGAGHFMLVSLATENQAVIHPAVVGNCRLLISNTNGFLGTMAFQVGSNPSWGFALPHWLPNMTLHFQDWILNAGAFESTQRLSVPIAK